MRKGQLFTMKLTIIVFYFTLSLVYCLPNHLRSYIHLMQQQQHSRALRDTVANTTNENNSSSSLFCKAQGCKKEGEQCSGSFSNPEGCHVDCCAYGLECVAVEDGYSICLHNTLNMSCSDNEKLCMRGEQCSVNSSCIGIYAPGDSCTSNSDCVLQNTCNSRGICEGLPENASCTPFSYECDYGFYCSPKTSTCQKQRGSGEGCDSPNACKWLHVCVTGTCRRLWTQQAGSSCIPDDWDYSNCDFGLECLNDSCVHPQRQENVPCIVDSDCPGNEECLCNDFLGGFYCDRPLYTDGCAAEFKSMLQCAENHSCIIEGEFLFNRVVPFYLLFHSKIRVCFPRVVFTDSVKRPSKQCLIASVQVFLN